MAGGGYGNNPWGGSWGGSDEGDGSGLLEHIPNSPLWNIFDLRGVRQPNDMDRVRDFIEVTGYGQPSQFFVNSFNIASGGSYPTTTALLDIALPVTLSYTVEYRIQANALPNDFADPVGRHLVLAINSAAGPCATFLLSVGGVAYTGAVSYDLLNNNQISFDHVLNPSGGTIEEKSLIILPGSDQWLTLGQEVYVRVVADWENQLLYLYVTDAANIVPGVGGADSTGHVLRALLPIIPAATAVSPPIDRIAVSASGSLLDEASLELFHYNLSSKLLLPDLPPRALAGPDQAGRLCSIIKLDGSGSFDPEGNAVTYDWRLIDAPEPSLFVGVGSDGQTTPRPVPTGFTDKFTSAELGTLHALEPVVPGDVITVGGASYTVESVKPESEAGTFYVVVQYSQIPDDLYLASFKLLRQAAISGRDTVTPTFYPDVPGFYIFDLRVFDGVQWSSPNGLDRAVTVVNVLESPLPRGCTPDLSFLFDYLSDFWSLVEDSEKLHVFWGALGQTAATEMLTLWQHDYSKSIRDIQRTFTRRWLHYDLVLGEPLPELTKLRPVWGGVLSSTFTDLYVNTRRLGISSPLFEEDVVITFSGLDPVDPYIFSGGLSRKLQEAHPSFVVSVVELAGVYALRINAQIPFTVTTATTSLFTPGQASGAIIGAGTTVGPRTFLVDTSLEGLDLAGAFLVLNNEAYVIDRVVSVSGDTYPGQRVVVGRDLPEAYNGPYTVTGWVSSELINFYDGLVTAGDFVDFVVLEAGIDVAETRRASLIVSTRAYGASPVVPKKLPIDFAPLGAYLDSDVYTVRLARVLRKGHIPVDNLIVDVPTLQESVVSLDDTTVLRRNLDFFLEEFRGKNSIRFVSGQNNGPDVFEGQRPPARLWAEYSYLDNKQTIENNFGVLVDLKADQLSEISDDVDYLSAVAGLMYAYTNGPTVRNLRIGMQILLGLPYAEEDGTIVEIRKDLLSTEARILVRDTANPEIVRAYNYPKLINLEINPVTGVPYAVGDTVTRFSPLTQGASVIDYVKDPTWFQGLIGQGSFTEIQKYHTFVTKIDRRAFSLASLLPIRDFVLKLKPTYTLPRFIVTTEAGSLDGDEISVNDTRTYRGYLALEDAPCRQYLGASTVFDQPWPGGGQPWPGDTGNNHNSPWRNKYDYDGDLNTYPVYPIGESDILWGFDKNELLCPHDVITTTACANYPVPFTPAYDTVFAFDTGTYTMYEGSAVGPVAVPAGPTGVVFPISPGAVTAPGTIEQLRVVLLGANIDAITAYEIVVLVNAIPVHVHPFTASGFNQELLVTGLSLSIVPGDSIGLTLRTASQAASAGGWSRVSVRAAGVTLWTFDDTFPAGTYCSATVS